MATYAAYYRPNLPLVYDGAPLYPAIAPPHPALQLHELKPQLLPASKQERILGSTSPTIQREPLSTSLTRLPTSSQDSSPFFKLPAELRNKIYTSLLCPDAADLKTLQNRATDLSVRHYNQTCTPTSLHPALLSTCRRIYDEARSLLYAPHVFHAHPSLLTSLPHLTSAARPVLYPSATALISRWQICLRLDTDPRFTAAQATAAFSGATYLEIRVWQAQFESCDYAVLKLFAGVRGVRFARVGGDVETELAGWLEARMMMPEEGVCCGGEECVAWKGRGEVLCGRCFEKASSLGRVG